MSEYQYYEFLAIDRPLSEDEIGALRALSTRATITPVSFTNEYNWGDLKGDPQKLVQRTNERWRHQAPRGIRRSKLNFSIGKEIKPECLYSYCGHP